MVQEEMAAFRIFVSRWEEEHAYCEVKNNDDDSETKSYEIDNHSHSVKNASIDEYDKDKSKGECVQYRGEIIVPWIGSMNVHLCLSFAVLWVSWNALNVGICYGIFTFVFVHFLDNRILYKRIVRDFHEKRNKEGQKGEDCGNLVLVEGIPLASPVSVAYVV
ncbi:hypothetical protein ACHAXS_006216 [Conticribra weissflogii]